MSLNQSSTLEPMLVDTQLDFQQPISLDADMFDDIIGFVDIKKIFMNAIHATDPVHIILVGPPGNGKTSFLKAVLETYPDYSLFIDSTISSGIGMIESIFEMSHRLRFLLVDEIEKFSSKDRKVLLNVLETGILSRRLRDSTRVLTNLNVWFFATCNNIWKMQQQQPELLNRCEILNIPELSYDKFVWIVGERLQREDGIYDRGIARYIAKRVYEEFGNETNIRRCVRVARLANSYVTISLEHEAIDESIVDEVIRKLKENIHTAVPLDDE